MKLKSYLLLLGIIFLAILSFSLISENGESRVAVWDGEGADALASNPLNWDMDTTPIGGDEYVASVYDLQMNTLILIIWLVLMIVFLLISLKHTEWGILGGIIWLLAGLLEFLDLNTTLGLIIISIGMFIMLYGILELMKR